MRHEDQQFVASCCFPTVLAALVRQGRGDIAAHLLSKKLRLHADADLLTGGSALLLKFLKRASHPAFLDQTNDNFKQILELQWSRDIIVRILQDLPSVAHEAMTTLSSSDL